MQGLRPAAGAFAIVLAMWACELNAVVTVMQDLLLSPMQAGGRPALYSGAILSCNKYIGGQIRRSAVLFVRTIA